MTKSQRIAIADWHGCKACHCWNTGDEAGYCRHIAIADRLWRK